MTGKSEMRVVGLVGGIGSGKSEAASLLASMGAAIVDADKIGHAVYEPGTSGFDEVVAAFGEEIVGRDGKIDRAELGGRVFSDPAALRRLNAIVHPRIRAEIERRIAALREQGETPLVVVEAAILLEAGWRSLVDEVWAVAASPQTVRQRLARGRGLTPEEVDARAARQMGEVERRAAADAVIENDGDLADLRRRLGEIWASRIAR